MNWIKVEDQYPPEGEIVWVYFPDYVARKGTQWEHLSKGFAEACYYEPSLYAKPVWIHGYYDYSMPLEPWPTHWMYLPQKPNE